VSVVMQEHQWSDGEKSRFDEFLAASSRALKMQSERCNASEAIFGASIDIFQMPLRSAEYRTFLYQDAQVRASGVVQTMATHCSCGLEFEFDFEFDFDFDFDVFCF
jgi:hypothetical protein